MEDIMNTVKAFEESGLIIKDASETTENGAKEQKGGFSSMLWGTLGASLFGNMLAGKGAKATRQGRGVIRADRGTTSAGQDF